MAKNKKKRRHSPASPGNRPKPPSARNDAKEAARARREREARTAARRGALRRALIGGGGVALVFVAVTWYIGRAPAATPLSQATIDAAGDGGCGQLARPD